MQQPLQPQPPEPLQLVLPLLPVVLPPRGRRQEPELPAAMPPAARAVPRDVPEVARAVQADQVRAEALAQVLAETPEVVRSPTLMPNTRASKTCVALAAMVLACGVGAG